MTPRHHATAIALLLVVATAAASAFGFELNKGSAKSTVATTPIATQFVTILETTVNTYGASHGDSRRLVNADCVSPSAGLYMCSYAVKRGAVRECHIMQGKWVPGGSYIVTKAGRVPRCSTLRAALASLG